MRPFAGALPVIATLALAALAGADDAARVSPAGSRAARQHAVLRESPAPPPILGHVPAPVLSHAPPPILGHAPAPMLGDEPASPQSPRSHAAEGMDPTRYDGLIREIAARHGVEYALVKAVIRAESAFDRLAVSPKGACGLMQLMPATAAEEQVRGVFVPRENIEGGCRYLRMLLDRYRGDLALALAAYNAGAERVEEARGVPPIAETREYLDRVLRYRLAYLREATGAPHPAKGL